MHTYTCANIHAHKAYSRHAHAYLSSCMNICNHKRRIYTHEHSSICTSYNQILILNLVSRRALAFPPLILILWFSIANKYKNHHLLPFTYVKQLMLPLLELRLQILYVCRGSLLMAHIIIIIITPPPTHTHTPAHPATSMSALCEHPPPPPSCVPTCRPIAVEGEPLTPTALLPAVKYPPIGPQPDAFMCMGEAVYARTSMRILG